MVKYSELPIFILMMFTLVYATIGNPNSEFWSGAYFIVNYLTLLLLFKDHKSSLVRLIGISLSVSILMFILLKYFCVFEIQRFFTIIPFGICIYGLYKIEKRCKNYKKNF
jgi:hypothetical protein